MLQLDVVTLFPAMFEAVTGYGVTARARERRLYELVLWNPRDFAGNAYRTVDDRPYGGGPGMVMMPEPLGKAVDAARQRQLSTGVKRPHVLHLSPQGRRLDHETVADLASKQGVVMIAGRYEGVDERVVSHVAHDELSLGDYVLSGGELAAMVVIDCVVRQLPGALGDAVSAVQDSFFGGLLDCPHYTRPEVYEGAAVPAVLLSGNHAEIARWRLKQALGRTWQRRPDLIAQRTLNALETALLEEFKKEAE
jgi:tRNA (guanine37-N1)-methyltransferase